MAAVASAFLPPPVKREPEYCEHLDLQSIKDVCGDSSHALVYGYGNCHYATIGHIFGSPLAKDGSPVRRVFNWQMIGMYRGHSANTTLEGRCMLFNLPIFPTTHHVLETARLCKNALVMVAVENYKRAREGLPLIPILFCIDIDDNPYPSTREYPALAALNRFDGRKDPMVTDKEMRRYDKLCTAAFENLPAESAIRLRRVSRSAVRWIYLQKTGKETYALRKISSPLDSPDWAYYSRMRQNLSRSVPKADPFNWKKAASREINAFDNTFARKYPCLLRYRCHPVQ